MTLPWIFSYRLEWRVKRGGVRPMRSGRLLDDASGWMDIWDGNSLDGGAAYEWHRHNGDINDEMKENKTDGWKQKNTK